MPTTFAKQAAKATRAYAARIAAELADPTVFADKVLGLHLTTKQREMMQAVASNRRVAVRSGQKTGKSVCAVVLALWWVCTKPRAIVILSSSSGRQVHDVLWTELSRFYRHARVSLGGQLNATPATGLKFSDGRMVIGFSTDKPENMAGFSGANLFYIVDEASGVAKEIFEPIEGNTAGGGRILLISNPTRTSGYFFDTFHAQREYWRHVHISSIDTAREVANDAVLHGKGLADLAWCEQQRHAWHEDVRYQVRVLGDFPAQASNAVIGLGLVEDARKRWDAMHEGGKVPDLTRLPSMLEIGVDVARYGDDETAIACVRGTYAYPLECFSSMNTIEVAAKVIEIVRARRRPGETTLVKVDANGVGAGVADRLRELVQDEKQRLAGVGLVDINSSERANEEDTYLNVRAEMAFSLREWLRSGGMIPNDPMLEGELLAPTFDFDLRNRQRIEPKDELKKRLGRSPDRADALGLAVYRRVANVTDLRLSGSADGRWAGMPSRHAR